MNSKSSVLSNSVNSNGVISKSVNGNSRSIIKRRNTKYSISSECRNISRRNIVIKILEIRWILFCCSMLILLYSYNREAIKLY